LFLPGRSFGLALVGSQGNSTKPSKETNKVRGYRSTEDGDSPYEYEHEPGYLRSPDLRDYLPQLLPVERRRKHPQVRDDAGETRDSVNRAVVSGGKTAVLLEQTHDRELAFQKLMRCDFCNEYIEEWEHVCEKMLAYNPNKVCKDCNAVFVDKHNLFTKCVHCQERDDCWRIKYERSERTVNE
jgi:hypothetical protein